MEYWHPTAPRWWLGTADARLACLADELPQGQLRVAHKGLIGLFQESVVGVLGFIDDLLDSCLDGLLQAGEARANCGVQNSAIGCVAVSGSQEYGIGFSVNADACIVALAGFNV